MSKRLSLSERLFYVPDIGSQSKVGVSLVLDLEIMHDAFHLAVLNHSENGEVHLRPCMVPEMWSAIDSPSPLDILPGSIASLSVGIEDLYDLLIVSLAV